MIKNERQYKITKIAASKFRATLQSVNAENFEGIDILIKAAAINGIKSQLDELDEELKEYEDLKSGQIKFSQASNIEDLPKLLIKARISSGLNQRELGDKLGLKEQQIQRYEDSEYATASLTKLIEVAEALDLSINYNAVFGVDDIQLNEIYRKLDRIGLSQNFVNSRLLTDESRRTNSASKRFGSFAHFLRKIYSWDAPSLLGNVSLDVNLTPAMTARFKVRKGQSEVRLSAYTVYAHYLATAIMPLLPEVKPNELPNSAETFYDNVALTYGDMNFESVLRYVWSLGIAVLPLNDRATFDGAYWREDNKHVIALGQRMKSNSYWLFDLLHDYFHATQHPESPDNIVIESPATSLERREAPDEIAANDFAIEVAMAGQQEIILEKAHELTGGNIKFLKSKVPTLASTFGVDVGLLANFLANQISSDGENWWGTAQQFQGGDNRPWEIARDIFIENLDFTKLPIDDKKLILLAISEE